MYARKLKLFCFERNIIPVTVIPHPFRRIHRPYNFPAINGGLDKFRAVPRFVRTPSFLTHNNPEAKYHCERIKPTAVGNIIPWPSSCRMRLRSPAIHKHSYPVASQKYWETNKAGSLYAFAVGFEFK
ncbi:hypothetical protein GWI33_018709 [Rhynchophorus ferrugineus]|uniref:Uncharacterized protein n=1 Tax=Rhynchophorus ferrugineus TaxID=354439 RepID=A0A834M4Y3_RHYFE|nr:hypothetical protein GWI33_018709 [Rhynchophorus ferrugineus]